MKEKFEPAPQPKPLKEKVKLAPQASATESSMAEAHISNPVQGITRAPEFVELTESELDAVLSLIAEVNGKPLSAEQRAILKVKISAFGPNEQKRLHRQIAFLVKRLIHVKPLFTLRGDLTNPFSIK